MKYLPVKIDTFSRLSAVLLSIALASCSSSTPSNIEENPPEEKSLNTDTTEVDSTEKTPTKQIEKAEIAADNIKEFAKIEYDFPQDKPISTNQDSITYKIDKAIITEKYAAQSINKLYDSSIYKEPSHLLILELQYTNNSSRNEFPHSLSIDCNGKKITNYADLQRSYREDKGINSFSQILANQTKKDIKAFIVPNSCYSDELEVSIDRANIYIPLTSDYQTNFVRKDAREIAEAQKQQRVTYPEYSQLDYDFSKNSQTVYEKDRVTSKLDKILFRTEFIDSTQNQLYDVSVLKEPRYLLFIESTVTNNSDREQTGGFYTLKCGGFVYEPRFDLSLAYTRKNGIRPGLIQPDTTQKIANAYIVPLSCQKNGNLEIAVAGGSDISVNLGNRYLKKSQTFIAPSN